ncbi:MAG: hypothetical protein ACYTG1_12405 [Planctomycetota bacterium]
MGPTHSVSLSQVGPPRAAHGDRPLHSAPHRRAPGADRVCLDCGGCRQKLNAADREIDRLRSGLAGRIYGAALRRVWFLAPRPVEPVATAELAPLSAPPADRRPYAPAPLGAVPEHRDPTPPDPAETVRVINPYHVTNLGTLLDVLA